MARNIIDLLLVMFLIINCCASNYGLNYQGQSSASNRRKVHPWRLAAIANKLFAHRLFQSVSRTVNQHQNFLISPYAVSAGLSMTLFGSRERTAEQIRNTLGYSEFHHVELFQNDQIPKLYKKLVDQLFDKDHGFTLTSANKLFGEETEVFDHEFLNGTEYFYGAPLQEVNFQDDPAGSRDIINSWAAQKTNYTIQEALSRNAVSAGTKLVLMSTIYFKGQWVKPFPTLLRSIFTTSRGRQINIDFMRGQFLLPCARAKVLKFLMIEMPYKTTSLEYQMTMELIIPHRNTVQARKRIEQQLTENNYYKETHKKEIWNVDLSMPKFQLEFGMDLKDNLFNMGIKDLFVAGQSNLSGMNGNDNLFLQSAEHKTFLKVDQKGTTAGASFGQAQTRTIPYVINVNHPFYIILREKLTRMPLFMGRILNPDNGR